MSLPLRALVLALVLASPVLAQAQTTTLFPGLTDGSLRVAIADTYTPVSVLSLTQSKDTLYAVIDVEQRGVQFGVAGIYSDFFVPFDCNPSCDPSQDVYNNAAGISQEHTWPRSQGAGDGNFERDLHHLFPAKQSVNAARSNYPFGEAPDAETTNWYYLATVQSTAPPTATRDLWSERQSTTRFEPREDRKGDVARAMFYAYAVYGPDGSGQASTPFWDDMRPYLLAWHRADPATAADVARSERVARYQVTGSGALAINPFVADSSLAARAFYPETLTASFVASITPQSPPIVVPAEGGRVTYTATLTNGAQTATTMETWLVVTLPDGSSLDPAAGPLSFTLVPGGSVMRTRSIRVPAEAPAGTYALTLQVGTFPDVVVASDSMSFSKTDLAAQAYALTRPEVIGVYPNPARDRSSIRFVLGEASRVRLSVHDVLGREVAILVDASLSAGVHEAELEAQRLAPGRYTFRLQVGQEVRSGSLMLVE